MITHLPLTELSEHRIAHGVQLRLPVRGRNRRNAVEIVEDRDLGFTHENKSGIPKNTNAFVVRFGAPNLPNVNVWRSSVADFELAEWNESAQLESTPDFSLWRVCTTVVLTSPDFFVSAFTCQRAEHSQKSVARLVVVRAQEMAAPEDTLLSVNQKTFVLRALIDGLRTDGRFFHESRKVSLNNPALLQERSAAPALPPPLAPCWSMV
jgi:hypothetical protein